MRKGQKASRETRRRMREAALNRTPEHRQALSEALKGRVPSPQCMAASVASTVGLVGQNARHWKGGRRVASNGYVQLLVPGTGSYVYEHRAVMAKKLGRKLKRHEIVHHIDGDKQNNDPANLELFESHAEHMRHHAACRRC